MTQMLTIGRKRYYLLDEAEYARLRRSNVPKLPGKDATGGVPAVAYVRALVARRIIEARESLGWSQAELARRAGIRTETLNRIEKCKHSADPKTIDKIEAAIASAHAS
jgi:ribosome-binding protein aMBF1 (putative translation factor)